MVINGKYYKRYAKYLAENILTTNMFITFCNYDCSVKISQTFFEFFKNLNKIHTRELSF